MTTAHEVERPGSARGPVWAVRRALAPAALELEGETRRLSEQVAELEQRLRSAEERLERVDQLERQISELRDGLHEARRLNLRIAELTDLVTEVVLPLHDREIDPAVLRGLRPDTL